MTFPRPNLRCALISWTKLSAQVLSVYETILVFTYNTNIPNTSAICFELYTSDMIEYVIACDLFRTLPACGPQVEARILPASFAA